MIVRKLGPPLLAGEPTSCGEDFPSVVFSFTHDALSDINFKQKKQPIKQLRIRYATLISVRSHVSLTLLLIKVTVYVSLHLCVAPITHPGQMFAGDGWTCLKVERSGVEGYFHVKSLHIDGYKLTVRYSN